MELELDGTSEIEMSGDIEITLPDYMIMLPQSELDDARRARQKEHLIVAAGRKPGSNDIVLFTADNRVYVFDTAKYEVPSGEAFPIDCGQSLRIHDANGFEVSSDWVLELSDAVDITLLS
jgi:hypothetical protein